MRFTIGYGYAPDTREEVLLGRKKFALDLRDDAVVEAGGDEEGNDDVPQFDYTHGKRAQCARVP